jgi:hypothetical protein
MKSTRKPRGRPYAKGQSGNPAGKPRGARNKATLAAETLFDGEAERLSRKAIEMALGGDATALRLCLERVLPARRERSVRFKLPPLKTIRDSGAALAAIIAAVAAGELTPGEAGELVKLVGAFVKAIEAGGMTEDMSKDAGAQARQKLMRLIDRLAGVSEPADNADENSSDATNLRTPLGVVRA